MLSGNAFALITAAHILTQQTKKHEQTRYEAKLRLIRLLYRREWPKQRIINPPTCPLIHAAPDNRVEPPAHWP